MTEARYRPLSELTPVERDVERLRERERRPRKRSGRRAGRYGGSDGIGPETMREARKRWQR